MVLSKGSVPQLPQPCDSVTCKGCVLSWVAPPGGLDSLCLGLAKMFRPGPSRGILKEVMKGSSACMQGYVAKLTEYVSRIRTPDGSYIWGKAGSDNCASCSNTCPCPNGTSWGFFPWTGPWAQGAQYFPGEVPVRHNSLDGIEVRILIFSHQACIARSR